MTPPVTNMEQLLAQLLVPDNDSISQATKTLKELFKTSEAVPMLCNVLTTSTASQIRQYAAVLLRKRLIKEKNWSKLPPNVKDMVKSGIIPVLIAEKEKSVKTSVVQFIGAIAKHELPAGNWPDLSKLLQALITSNTQSDVELGMFTMSVLTDVALDVFAANPTQFIFLFNTTFYSLDDLNSVLGYYTVVNMTRIVMVADSDPELKNIYIKAIPKVLTGLPALAAANEERALEVLDLFLEVLQESIDMLAPHMQQFIQFCLHITSNKNMGDSIRARVMGLISMAVRVKKKLIIKLLLVKPIVEVVFGVMCEAPEGGLDPNNDDDWFNEDDDDAPFQNATNTLGVLAIYLPPKHLLENLLQLVSGNLESGDLCVKKACYLALAAVTEGACEYIRNNYLNMFLQCVCAGITDNSPAVRNGALYALGQLSEHLQPEISEHHAELMPILFQYLSQLCQRMAKGGAEPHGLYSMFYALESFCENLEDKLAPYLPMLIERLLVLLDRKNCVNVQELAISAIGSAASAANQDILPYFPTIIEKLKTYLIDTPTEETSCLQVQALHTLSLMARTLGAEHFGPMAQETVQLGLKLLTGTEDPELKGAAFSLFASLAFVLKTDSAVFLPAVVEAAIVSLKSTEGIVAHPKEEDGPFAVFDDVSSDVADEEDIEKSSVASEDDLLVENPYMEEKEEACNALKDIALHAGPAFMPYLEKCFEEVFELTTFPYDDVRKSSMGALAQFCVNFAQIETPEGKQALQKTLQVVVPQCTDTASKDDECLVVNAALDALATMLKQIGPPVLAVPGSKEAILKVVNDVLLSQVECQDKEEEYDDEKEGAAEQDELLMETAGEVIPALGKAVDAAEFIICLQALLPGILPKLSKQSSVSQKSFFIGTLAECMAAAGPELQQRPELSQQLLNLYLPLAHDEHQEVRNNAIFGLGELVLHSKQSLYSKYMEILDTLSGALAKETYGIAVDNICGALARMILTNHELVPIDDVFPALLNKLPLKEDEEEHEAILQCFGHLYQLGHAALKSHITTVIRIVCVILLEKRGKPEVLGMTSEFLKVCHKDFTAEVTSVLQGFPPDAISNLNNLLAGQ